MHKYYKYKSKYLNLKGGNVDHKGINFEGGKIIKYILNSKFCIGYTNIQIAMDAPFLDAPAGENVRQKGPAETQLPGYDEKSMLNGISNIFEILINYATKKKADLVVQIARGRSGITFWEETVKPYLQKQFNYDFNNIIIKYGYRTNDYFDYNTMDKDFIFVNIGMFARLDHGLNPGDICIPSITYDITQINNKFVVTGITRHTKDIAYQIPNICKLSLIGISDDMKFITPEIYNEKDILKIFDYINKL